MKKFNSINPDKLKADYQHRFTKEEIVQKFDVLQVNVCRMISVGQVDHWGVPRYERVDPKRHGGIRYYKIQKTGTWLRHHSVANNLVISKFVLSIYRLKYFTCSQNNPFQDRLFSVFSSKNDNCFSFEDLLDMFSAMSVECPSEVKAAWAFRVYGMPLPTYYSIS